MEPGSDTEFWTDRDSRRAFDAIYSAYARQMLWYCLKHVSRQEDAEEIVNDCFVRLWKNRHSIKESVNVKAYLFKSVRNAVVDYYRHQAFSIVTDLQCELNDQIECSSDPTPPIEHDDFVRIVMNAIAKLPKTQSKSIELIRIQGRDIDEASEILGLNRQTVKNAMTTGVKALRISLKQYIRLLIVLSGYGYVNI